MSVPPVSVLCGGMIMETIVVLMLIGGLALIIWGLLLFVRAIGRSISPQSPPPWSASSSDELDGMNYGDYYNGPNGYSSMTGYPETQYGSGFDEDAEWHEEH